MQVGPDPVGGVARPGAQLRVRVGRGEELRPRHVDVLAHRQPDRRPHRRLDRGPAHLAVALRRVAVADREPGARHEDGQEQRRAGDEVAGVHVAAVDVGRDRAQRPGERARRPSRRRTARAGRGCPARTRLVPLAPGTARDLVERVGEVVGQQPEAGDVGGPAPVAPASSSRMSIWSVSPGSAPATSTGPLTWSTWSKIERPRSAVVESAVSWPFDASRQSNADDVARRRPSRPAGSPGPRPGGVASRATWIDRRVEHGRASSAGVAAAVTREPPSRQAGVAGALGGRRRRRSSVSPMASRTERSLSRSLNQK